MRGSASDCGEEGLLCPSFPFEAAQGDGPNFRFLFFRLLYFLRFALVLETA